MHSCRQDHLQLKQELIIWISRNNLYKSVIYQAIDGHADKHPMQTKLQRLGKRLGEGFKLFTNERNGGKKKARDRYQG